MPIPIISLFCGCGGFDWGFRQSGFEIPLAFDAEPIVVSTYNLNHGKGIARQTDLLRTTGQQIIEMWDEAHPGLVPRGVIGGSPCQTFSRSNVHYKSDDAKHLEKHILPRKYAAILKVLNEHYDLDFFVFENVQGLDYQKHRETFQEFKKLFEDAGFLLFEGLLDAINYRVPQHRPRVFVVGLNSRKYADASFLFPNRQAKRQPLVRSKLRGVREPLFFSHSLEPSVIKAKAGHQNHWTMNARSAKFQDGFLLKHRCKGRSFRVLSWDKPSWTVAYGHREIHVHPNGKRRLSIFEAMQLQGFPKRYKLLGNFSEQVSQVSDAIPPPVGKALGQAIFSFLEAHPCEDC